MLTVRDAATVAVAPLQGGPRATAEKLAPAIAEALQKRDIPASDRTTSIASYQLDGRLQAMPPAGDKAAIVVLWNLRDPSGKSLGTRAERIEASAGDWQAGKTRRSLVSPRQAPSKSPPCFRIRRRSKLRLRLRTRARPVY